MKRTVSLLISFIMLISLSMVLCTDAYAGKVSIKSTRSKFKIVHIIHIPRVVEIKKATCTSRGYVKTKCRICGKTSFSYTPTGKHTYDGGVVTKEPTCIEDGLMTYHCVKCNARKWSVIPKKGHTTVIDEAVPATCSEYGLTEGSHCSVCGKVFKEQIMLDMVDCNIVTEIVPAVPGTNGYEKEYCTSCDYEYVRTITAPYRIRLSLDDKNYITEFAYTGKPVMPRVKVVDRWGKEIACNNYKLYYNDNIQPGTATVIVDFGDVIDDYYNGTMTTKFTISESESDSGDTETTKPDTRGALVTPQIIREEAGMTDNSIMLYHTSAGDTTAYDVMYSTDANFKSPKTIRVKASNNGSFCTSVFTVSAPASMMNKEVTYYLRIRAVDETTNAKTDWSTAKSKSILIKNNNIF